MLHPPLPDLVDVVLPPDGALGMQLTWSIELRAYFLAAFPPLPESGEPGQAERDGVVRVGAILVRMNGHELEGRPKRECLKALRARTDGNRVLTFKQGTDQPEFMSDASEDEEKDQQNPLRDNLSDSDCGIISSSSSDSDGEVVASSEVSEVSENAAFGLRCKRCSKVFQLNNDEELSAHAKACVVVSPLFVRPQAEERRGSHSRHFKSGKK